METYIDRYNKALGVFKQEIHAMMNEIVMMLKTISCEPLHIGNTYYYYVNYNGEDVPAYCSDHDYENGNRTFEPIYDENQTYEFGWIDMQDCCRIFEVIRKRLLNNSSD